ncbi:glucose 1-dehydrogenase [Roseateles asaccharophilus]|uniref:NAD(P)-dependent dehydrogenase (Short-subunit alcohol dehydrogenase family) n=1 Tax=Roseateles asaccharophilus TaxID=582607 RepID=A0ABU2A6U8_9BURK|nr:glucose 1-dehydrogenase [Roseateles asaccharophilus]MDR7332929.1 NAD(P)-dependent dehydrogenase (short-subunit alcohol dehydrogenase family) [Roseateles asaccharophilus]
MTSPQVVLITGALTGIGRATALAFAKEGAQLVVSGRRDAEGEGLATELEALGVRAAYIRADVRHEAEVRSLIEQTLERFGRLDVAVNNAGIEGDFGPISDTTEANYEAVFDTNVRGVVYSLKHELRAMQAQGGGSIVNVSSVLGRVGYAGFGVYTASKHAVDGLTRTAALEGAAFGVRVNGVAPGPVETPMLNRLTGHDENAKAQMMAGMVGKRAADPDEIAQAIVFLASNRSRFMTGETVAIDGGHSAG